MMHGPMNIDSTSFSYMANEVMLELVTRICNELNIEMKVWGRDE